MSRSVRRERSQRPQERSQEKTPPERTSAKHAAEIRDTGGKYRSLIYLSEDTGADAAVEDVLTDAAAAERRPAEPPGINPPHDPEEVEELLSQGSSRRFSEDLISSTDQS